ncbi:hypothetical protein GA0115253_109876, partial [Streptomyces sp. Termitarium-T10T-6]
MTPSAGSGRAQTSSAAASEQPPAKTERRRRTARSAASSRSQDQSTTARRVCWRGSTVRLPLVRRRKRSSSRSAIWARGEHPQPGGGQFDGERQPVQPTADLGAGGGGRLVRVGAEAGAGGGPAFGEQPQGHRVGQRVDGADELAGYAEGFAAGGDDGELRAVGQQMVGEGGGRADDVLAVVQQEQHPARGAVLGEPYERVTAGAVGGAQLLGARPAQHGLAGPERAEDRLGHGVRVVDGGQFGEPDAVGPGFGGGLRGLLRQPGLARAAGPEQGDQPGAAEVLAQGCHVGVAPDEAGEPGAEVAGGGRGRGGGRLGRGGYVPRGGDGPGRGRGPRGRGGPGRGSRVEQLRVQAAQGRSRGGAEAVVEQGADLLVRGQRLGGASRRPGQGPDAAGPGAVRRSGWVSQSTASSGS